MFRKGDTADAMYYSVTGRYRLKEMGIEIPVGHVFGDLGFLAPDNLRTQTIECMEDGDVLTATYQQVKELYFQNPQFGFFFMRLTSERLFDNIKRLEQEIVRKNEVIAELGGKPLRELIRLFTLYVCAKRNLTFARLSPSHVDSRRSAVQENRARPQARVEDRADHSQRQSTEA